MKLTHHHLGLAAALAASSAGCATIFNGTHDDISITSTPAQATFTVVSAGGGITATHGVEMAQGVTPATVHLSKKSNYELRVTLAGYKEARVPISQEFNGWIIASAFCGLIPAGVDVLTGAMWDLEPERISVTLQPAGATPNVPAPTPAPAPAPAGTAIPIHAEADGSEPRMYLVLYRKGPDGELRQLSVPLVRNPRG